QLGGRPAAVCLRDPRPLASHGQGPCGDDRGFSRRAGETVRPVVAGERLRAEVIDGRRSPDRRGTSRTADRAVHAGTDRRGAPALAGPRGRAQRSDRGARPRRSGDRVPPRRLHARRPPPRPPRPRRIHGDGYVQALRGTVESTKPRVILVAHTSQGYDFAPALAGTMDLPPVTNCLAVDLEGDRLVATRRLLNEKVQAQVEIRSDRPVVVTMRPGAVKAMGPAQGMMTVTDVPVTLDPSSIRETFVRLERPQVQDIDLSTADIIVSAGRGI